jgi:hypothetical protein
MMIEAAPLANATAAVSTERVDGDSAGRLPCAVDQAADRDFHHRLVPRHKGFDEMSELSWRTLWFGNYDHLGLHWTFGSRQGLAECGHRA